MLKPYNLLVHPVLVACICTFLAYLVNYLKNDRAVRWRLSYSVGTFEKLIEGKTTKSGTQNSGLSPGQPTVPQIGSRNGKMHSTYFELVPHWTSNYALWGEPREFLRYIEYVEGRAGYPCLLGIA